MSEAIWLAVKDPEVGWWEPSLEDGGCTYGLGVFFGTEAEAMVFVTDVVMSARLAE